MHKYLEDANISLDNIPSHYTSQSDSREEKWEKEREKYGFDERETWNLNDYFFVWFFERLSMYNEVNNVDTNSDYEKLENGMTFQECINELLDLSKFIIRFDIAEYEELKAANKEYTEKYNRFMELFPFILPSLWW